MKKSSFLSKKILTCLFASLFSCLFATPLFFSCSYGLEDFLYRKTSVEKRASSIKTITAPVTTNIQSGTTYTFLVISDSHFGAKTKADIQSFLDKIAAMSPRPAFCVNCGDVAEHGLSTEYDDFIAKIVQPLENLGIKTVNIVGNHDLYNDGWDSFEQKCYPYTSFYKFGINNISFYFIDSGANNLSEPQFSILKNQLKNDANKKIIFSHTPLYAGGALYFVMQNTQERNKLISLCENNNVSYFVAGHYHEWPVSKFNNFTEVEVPGFLEYGGWVIFTVNQADDTVDFEILHHQIESK